MAAVRGKNHEPSLQRHSSWPQSLDENHKHSWRSSMAAVFGRKSRTFFIEAQLLATVFGRKSRTFFLEAQLHGRNLWTKITILLYRGTAPARIVFGQTSRTFFLEAQLMAAAFGRKSRTFFIEAQLLAAVLGRNSRSFFIEAQLLATVLGGNHEPSL